MIELISSGQQNGLEALLAAAPPETVWRETVLPAAREVITRHLGGEFILPRLLRSLEVVQRARELLGPERLLPRGRIVIATLPGDVHDIGTALLNTVLTCAGYGVHDLGRQVPIDAIINTAVQTNADAIGLSALLVTSSRHMPRCIQALDARGLDIPVLVGGAAINRAFGRRSAILPDGRIYAPGVFYCRDVFEGLATMDALVEPIERSRLVEQARTQIAAERDQTPQTAVRPTSGPARLREAPVAAPPYYGARPREADLRDVWHSLDRNTLFRFHWGGHRATDAAYATLVDEYFEPTLARLTEDAVRDGWLEAGIVSGYFACKSEDDSLLLFEGTRLEFPRQSEGERLCLADYFSREQDVVALQAVTVGPRAGEYIERLQRQGQYERMLLVNGLASATAEALAEHAHQLARGDLGLAATRGLRFSWGYAACPDLAEQHKVLALLQADSIGLRLTESDTLAPEHSTVAIVVHHPDAKYFSVR